MARAANVATVATVEKAMLFLQYGFCTCLGLALMGLAALTAQSAHPEASSMPQSDLRPAA